MLKSVTDEYSSCAFRFAFDFGFGCFLVLYIYSSFTVEYGIRHGKWLFLLRLRAFTRICAPLASWLSSLLFRRVPTNHGSRDESRLENLSNPTRSCRSTRRIRPLQPRRAHCVPKRLARLGPKWSWTTHCRERNQTIHWPLRLVQCSFPTVGFVIGIFPCPSRMGTAFLL